MRAEAWLGASGCARGSHTCTGTSPALAPKPSTSRTNATPAVPERGSTRARSVNAVPPPAAASTANPAVIATMDRCVITAYQSPASRAAAEVACSASTSTAEAPAMSSQASRNDTTSPAAGTSCSPSRNTASATHWVREAVGPCT